MRLTKDDIKHGAFVADWQASEQLAENLDVSLTDLFTFYEYYLLGKNPRKSLVDELEAEFQGKSTFTKDLVRNKTKLMVLLHSASVKK